MGGDISAWVAAWQDNPRTLPLDPSQRTDRSHHSDDFYNELTRRTPGGIERPSVDRQRPRPYILAMSTRQWIAYGTRVAEALVAFTIARLLAGTDDQVVVLVAAVTVAAAAAAVEWLFTFLPKKSNTFRRLLDARSVWIAPSPYWAQLVDVGSGENVLGLFRIDYEPSSDTYQVRFGQSFDKDGNQRAKFSNHPGMPSAFDRDGELMVYQWQGQRRADDDRSWGALVGGTTTLELIDPPGSGRGKFTHAGEDLKERTFYLHRVSSDWLAEFGINGDPVSLDYEHITKLGKDLAPRVWERRKSPA